MEQLAVPPSVMRQRVEEALDLLGLAELRQRALHVAVGRAAAAGRDRCGDDRASAGAGARRADVGPRSGRGRGGARRDHPDRARSRRHRAAGRAPARAGGAIRRPGGVFARRRHGAGRVARADARERGPVAPPIIELGRLAQWTPLPLSVRDARRSAASLRQAIGRTGRAERPSGRGFRGVSGGEVVLDARGVVVRYGPVTAVAGADLTLRAGEVTALMGRNGSGKSSLLWALSGVGPAPAGHGYRRRAGDAGAADAVGPALPRHGGGRAGPSRPGVRTGRRCGRGPRTARPARAGYRRWHRSARPVRGAAAGAGAGDPTAGSTPGGAARRADPGPGLRRQARAHSNRRSAGRGADGRW